MRKSINIARPSWVRSIADCNSRTVPGAAYGRRAVSGRSGYGAATVPMQNPGDGRRRLRICAVPWGMFTQPLQQRHPEGQTALRRGRIRLFRNKSGWACRKIGWIALTGLHQLLKTIKDLFHLTGRHQAQSSIRVNEALPEILRGYAIRRNPFQFFRARSGQFSASISPVDRLTHSRAAVPSWRPMPSVAARFIAILRRHAAARSSGRAAAALAAERSS